MGKKISVTVDEDLHKKIEQRVKQLGISKSAFVSFASSFFLHQLEQTEARTQQYSLSAYQMIKHNLEMQQEALKNSQPTKKTSSTAVKKKKKKKK